MVVSGPGRSELEGTVRGEEDQIGCKHTHGRYGLVPTAASNGCYVMSHTQVLRLVFVPETPHVAEHPFETPRHN